MAYVSFVPGVQKQLDKTSKTMRIRLQSIIERLKAWPEVSGVKPLSGNLAGSYRIRTGDWRVQFHVDTDADEYNVVIEKIGHRDGFYDN